MNSWWITPETESRDKMREMDGKRDDMACANPDPVYLALAAPLPNAGESFAILETVSTIQDPLGQLFLLRTS